MVGIEASNASFLERKEKRYFPDVGYTRFNLVSKIFYTIADIDFYINGGQEKLEFQL